MRVAVQVNEAQLARLTTDLEAFKNGAEKVLVRACNKVARSTRTTIARKVRAEIAVKAGDVNKSITVRSANYRNPSATVKIRGRRLPLIQFGARQTKKGISYRISKTSGRKTIAGGFLAAMPTGHRGAFVRKGRERLPIKELFGPSIPAVVADIRDFASGRLRDDVEKKLSAEIDNQIAVFFERGGK